MDKLLRFFGLIRFSVADKKVTELYSANVHLMDLLDKYNCKYKGDSSGDVFAKLKYQGSVIDKFEIEISGLRKENAKYKQQFSGMQAKIDKQALRLGDKCNE